MASSTLQKRMTVSALTEPKIIIPAIGSAFAKLDPRTLIKNPVMFVVEVVAALTTVIFLRDLATGGENLGFTYQIIVWLWFTVLFANFAEAVAEGRGKAQAESLRRTRTETQAKLLTNADRTKYKTVPGTSLKIGDIVLVEAGDIIPSDGEVIEGVASVNEGAITGESAPVIRESWARAATDEADTPGKPDRAAVCSRRPAVRPRLPEGRATRPRHHPGRVNLRADAREMRKCSRSLGRPSRRWRS